MALVRDGFMVRSGEDRTAASLNFINGRFDLKISGRDTGGALCAYDTWRFKPGGPPLHLHFDVDEWFMILEGDFKFRVGDRMFEVGSGDSVFGPRGVPHAFRSLSQTARMLVTFQPAGVMEAFFAHELLDPLSDEFKEVSRRHNMDVVGPPLPD